MDRPHLWPKRSKSEPGRSSRRVYITVDGRGFHMTKRVEFEAKGGSMTGELAEPEGAARVPTVVLVQEWWGINAHIKSLAERLAAAGFLVLAPDLFHGKIA